MTTPFYKQARPYFDDYTLRHSRPRELAEVLAYTHIHGEHCLGRVLRFRAALLIEASRGQVAGRAQMPLLEAP